MAAIKLRIRGRAMPGHKTYVSREELVGLDPHRVLASGEKLSSAKRRMFRHPTAVRLEAMRQVKVLIRRFRMSLREAEDHVYGVMYPVEKFRWLPTKAELKLFRNLETSEAATFEELCRPSDGGAPRASKTS